MSFNKNSSRLAWLLACLSCQRYRLTKLLGRLSNFGVMQAMSPRLLGKFLTMLDQIAAEKEKEISIINQIEAVERMHNYRRDHNQLATCQTAPNFSHLASVELMPRKSRKLTWLYLWGLLFASSANSSQQKQKLKVG